MYKYISVLFLAALFQIPGAKAEVTRDSIGVENLKGKKVIIHRIVAHDTYYSVARRYNVSPKDIITFNDSKYLQIGVVIKVPTTLNFNETQAGKVGTQNQIGEGTTNNQDIEYTIKPKDNLNRLAEKYGTTVGELKRINNLNSINLHIGQVLRIPVKGDMENSAESQTSMSVPAATPAPISSTVKTNPIEITRKPDSGLTKTVNNSTATTPAASKQGANRANTPAANMPAANKAIPNTPAATSPATTANTDADEELVVHTVASNETIYSIATTYHITMDQVKAKNNMTNNSLHVGQRLLIKGQYGRAPKQTSSEPLTSNDTTLKDPSLRGAPSKYGLNQVDEKGTGIWIIDPDLDPIKMLVLHRSAPIGTIIKVTNPMTNRSTFAKVVGKFTENETTKDVIIVMTKAVAESIGALDKRFFCNLTYSGQEIEQ
jgi:peptidoglycan endopeptidase LytF